MKINRNQQVIYFVFGNTIYADFEETSSFTSKVIQSVCEVRGKTTLSVFYDQDFVDSQASRAPSELIRALFICDAIT